MMSTVLTAVAAGSACVPKTLIVKAVIRLELRVLTKFVPIRAVVTILFQPVAPTAARPAQTFSLRYGIQLC